MLRYYFNHQKLQLQFLLSNLKNHPLPKALTNTMGEARLKYISVSISTSETSKVCSLLITSHPKTNASNNTPN